ncbi:MAG TPA: CBS domain-containing protein [Gemmatimonadota bacterium]|nr:CBS domain-containing protein [Gemmatimonadota bacterium]
MPKLMEVMTSNVVTVGPQTSLRELVGVLRDERVSGVPVVSGGRVVGVVSATDLLDFEFEQPPEGPTDWEGLERISENSAEESAGYYGGDWDASVDVLERMHRVEDPEWDRLLEHSVSEVMTPVIYGLPPNEDLRSVASYMVRQGIHRVLVLERDELIGIASAMDIVRAVAVGIL